MKKKEFIALMLLVLLCGVFAVRASRPSNSTPLYFPFLQTDFDGNSFNGTNFLSLQISVMKSDPFDAETSIVNALGGLTNNGAGVFGFVMELSATNGIGSTPTFYGTSTFQGSGGDIIAGVGTIYDGDGTGLSNLVNQADGTYGDGTHVATITTLNHRITTIASTTITGAAPTGSAGGDLTGTYPNPTIKASVSLTTPNIGLATGTLTGTATLVTQPPILSFASDSNSITMSTNINNVFFYVANKAVSLTNVTLSIAGQMTYADFVVSNSLATSITNYETIPGAKIFGVNSATTATNAIIIPAAKEAYWHIECRGINETNVFVCLQQ